MGFTTVSQISLSPDGGGPFPIFYDTDLDIVSHQSGANSATFRPGFIDGVPVWVAIGATPGGAPLTDPNDLVALPCPPFDRIPPGVYESNPELH